MKINIFCNTKDSFYLDYASEHISFLRKRFPDKKFLFFKDSIKSRKGDLALFISYNSKLTKKELSLHKKNVVFHPSKLPYGRGSAAVAWTIIKNKKKLWVSTFQPNEKIDKGKIIFQTSKNLRGNELSYTLRKIQFDLILKQSVKIIKYYPNYKLASQKGKSCFFKKREPRDSQLDINKSIKSQFNLLRICDNERYPAFFFYKNKKYIIKIFD